jgi:hypothetical protein
VAANGYHKTQALDRQPADNEDRALRGLRKQHQRRYREKETGWHHHQSGISHGLRSSLSGEVQ